MLRLEGKYNVLALEGIVVQLGFGGKYLINQNNFKKMDYLRSNRYF